MDDRCSRVRFSAEAGNFSLHHRVQNGSGAHPASYPMCNRGSFPGGKADGAWSWPLTSILCRGHRMSGTIPLFPQYAFIVWCSVKAQGQFYLHLVILYFTFFLELCYFMLTSHPVYHRGRCDLKKKYFSSPTSVPKIFCWHNSQRKFQFCDYEDTVLSEPPVTMAWRILRLQMEWMASI
jgi:uncharacterized membrane protein (GlpM family)